MYLSRCYGNSVEKVRRSLVGRKGLAQREEPFALLASQYNWMMVKQVIWPWSSCFKIVTVCSFVLSMFSLSFTISQRSPRMWQRKVLWGTRVYYPPARICYHTIDNVIPLITLLAARCGKEKVLWGCTIHQQQLAQHIVVGERQTYDLCVWCLPMPTRSVAEPKAKSSSAKDFVWHRCVQIRVLSQYLNLDRLLCQYSPSVLECPIAHMLVC